MRARECVRAHTHRLQVWQVTRCMEHGSCLFEHEFNELNEFWCLRNINLARIKRIVMNGTGSRNWSKGSHTDLTDLTDFLMQWRIDVVLALYQRCTLKDDISYLLPTWLSAGTWKLKRKHHFIGWQERTNKMKNKSCATNFATQQPFFLLLLLQEPFLLAERKKMCYLSMAANQSQYTNINSFILGYIY